MTGGPHFEWGDETDPHIVYPKPGRAFDSDESMDHSQPRRARDDFWWVWGPVLFVVGCLALIGAALGFYYLNR